MALTRNESGILCPREGARAWLLEIKGPWGKVVVDYCPECESVWFDGGELESALDSRLVWEQMLRGMRFESGYGCPRCGGSMVVAFANSVASEVCRHCRGAWILRSDLEALTRASEERKRAAGGIGARRALPVIAGARRVAGALRDAIRRRPRGLARKMRRTARARPSVRRK
jgi:Zn-finger nucleic acid-binding protein